VAGRYVRRAIRFCNSCEGSRDPSRASAVTRDEEQRHPPMRGDSCCDDPFGVSRERPEPVASVLESPGFVVRRPAPRGRRSLQTACSSRGSDRQARSGRSGLDRHGRVSEPGAIHASTGTGPVLASSESSTVGSGQPHTNIRRSSRSIHHRPDGDPPGPDRAPTRRLAPKATSRPARRLPPLRRARALRGKDGAALLDVS
jgi:hypothetical protein